ncbi:hypothetical protein [Candidatus Methylacidithermus pantelleriae]|uniref:FecR protein domain-containing protein n=1 Tax=Candidatus Methylacidithermus pantelleriae TaxID=2744239 RepID=A0A8J2FTR9_9BACT|nr:hypothetical protein [Candidatus Methylacidithermus pantelleriae]CAF0703259.1 hypothetical protein MPNT_530003 [Candidatus Methylacidithermus pantelleriae]
MKRHILRMTKAKKMLVGAGTLLGMVTMAIALPVKGKVLWREGRAERIGGTGTQTLQVGDEVGNGLLIRTGSDGAALLEFFPKCFVLVRPNSELSIQGLASEQVGQGKYDAANVELRRGEIFTSLHKLEGRTCFLAVNVTGRRVYAETGLYSLTRREGRVAVVLGRGHAVWHDPNRAGTQREWSLGAGQWLFFGEADQGVRVGSVPKTKLHGVQLVALSQLQPAVTGLQGWIMLQGAFDMVTSGPQTNLPLVSQWNQTASVLEQAGDPPDPLIPLPPVIAARLIEHLERLLAIFPPNSAQARMILELIQEISPH